MRNYTHDEAHAAIDQAFDEADAEIWESIKRHPEERTGLLAQIDVLSTARNRIHARFDQPRP